MSTLKPSVANKFLRDVPSALRNFLDDYFVGDRIRLRPPACNILILDGVTSFVLYRDQQYQVELIIIAPHTVIPMHAHDDVQSYEVAISGDLEFFVDGKQSGFFRSPRADGMSRDFGKYVPVSSDSYHGGKVGAAGASFLSVQLWRDGVTPSHVIANWRGDTVGREHDRLLAT